QRRTDARIRSHHAVGDRHVQILADQHALSLQIEVGHLDDGHVFRPVRFRFHWMKEGRSEKEEESSSPFFLLPDSVALTWRYAAPRWCRACGSRSPTRCRTTSRPSRGGRSPW